MYNITNKILREVKNTSLNESGIQLPKGTRTVKLLYHADMDGVFSALFAYNQLKKQGFNDKTIKLSNIQYGEYGDKSTEKVAPKKGQALVVVDFAALPDETKADFVSDHHVDSEGKLTKGKSGSIGRTEFGSDSEHIAVSYAGNIADSTTIKAVTNIDSAKYKNLLDTMTLPTDFKSKGRMDRLAIIVNTLLSALIKKNPEAVNHIIRTAQPSLVSVYTASGNAFKLNSLQNQGLDEISSPKPDWNKIDKIRKQLGGTGLEVSKDKAREGGRREDMGTSKDYIEKMRAKGEEDLSSAASGRFTRAQREELERKKEEKKKFGEAHGRAKKADTEEITSERDAKKKAVEDLEAEKKKRQGKFSPVNPLLVRQDATVLKNYPGRYTWTLLSTKGKRFPFSLKRFGNMIQISVNPDLDLDSKEKVNLYDDLKNVLEVIKRKYMSKYNEWAFDVITKESGGHKQIATVSGLGVLGLMAKEKRERLKELESLEDRAKKVGKPIKEIMPKKAEELDKLTTIKKTNASVREEIMDDIEREFNRIIKDKYSGMAVTKPADRVVDIPETFTDKVLKNLQS